MYLSIYLSIYLFPTNYPFILLVSSPVSDVSTLAQAKWSFADRAAWDMGKVVLPVVLMGFIHVYCIDPKTLKLGVSTDELNIVETCWNIYIYNASIWSIQPPTCDPPTKSAHLCVFLTPDTLVTSRFALRKTNPKREREGEKKYIPIYIYIYRYEHIVYMNICVFLRIKTCYRKIHLLGRRFFETGWNPGFGPGGCFHHRGPRCQSKVTSLIPTWPGANKNLPSGKLT